jgi:hypothetical protein
VESARLPLEAAESRLRAGDRSGGHFAKAVKKVCWDCKVRGSHVKEVLLEPAAGSVI